MKYIISMRNTQIHIAVIYSEDDSYHRWFCERIPSCPLPAGAHFVTQETKKAQAHHVINRK